MKAVMRHQLDDVKSIAWLKKPQPHDYPCAVSYLSLIMAPEAAQKIAAALKDSSSILHPAKDVLRASGLPLLDRGDEELKKVHEKILAGTKLSPVLLCRDKAGSRVIIADGYHRLCAAYHIDENATVPCRIV